jgi:predicted transposase YdaD
MEIQTMFLIRDIRESRVYPDAFKEGYKQGVAIGREEGIDIVIVKLAGIQMSVEETADIFEVDVERVRRVLAQANGD